MSFVIFDLEYTSWKGCQEKGWKGKQKKEIVQCAAIKVSDDLMTVLGEFNVYCRPKINPVLSEYFKNLTGITNQLIQKEGVSFLKAYRQFKKFVGSDKCFSHAWGRPWEDKADGDIIQENLKLNNLAEDDAICYYNIAAWFQEKYQENHLKNIPKSSGQIAKVLKRDAVLKKRGLDEHNALYDVYSILEGLRFFEKH